MDPNQQSTGLPTGEGLVVNSPQQGPTQTLPVNPAQTPLTPPSLDPQLIANYEGRIRDLMSQKDKAIHERDQAITNLTNLQREYTQNQQSTHQSLNDTAQAAQTAIDHARAQDLQIQQLRGELLRATTLLEKPHLAPYSQFIPTSGDATEMKALVEQLEAVRNQDLERARAAQTPYGQFQQNQPALPALPGQQPGQQQQLPNQINPWNLYANRPNLAPGLAPPASSPAMMNPAGAGNPTDAIQQMLNDALRSGDSGKYEQALAQAATLANSAVRQQLG